MSFKSSFDGFVIIHAPFACPERRIHFEKELPRVGVDTFSVAEARPVDGRDCRLRNYVGSSQAILSLTDGFVTAVDLAESAGWNSVVIMEDDVAFRRTFASLWAEVEDEVRDTNWGILTLHRKPCDGSFLTPEPVLSRTALVPIFHNTGNYCVIVKSAFYSAFRHSLQICVDRGYPCDFFYGVFSELSGPHIFATNRNLTGQAPGLASTLTPRPVRRRSFYSRFRSAPWPQCLVLNPLHSVYISARSLLTSAGDAHGNVRPA
jgi:hypothetical protein